MGQSSPSSRIVPSLAQQPESPLERALEFTSVYTEYENADPLVREQMCLRAQIPSMFAPIRPGNWFAGRVDLPLVGLSPEWGGLGYYCNFAELQKIGASLVASSPKRHKLEAMLEFWRGRTTAEKCRAAFPVPVARALPSDDYVAGGEISFPLYRIAGTCMDYSKLLHMGIPGLVVEVEKRRRVASVAGQNDLSFYNNLITALDLFVDVAHRYAAQALSMAQQAGPADQGRLETLAASLTWIIRHPPETFHQAVQLFWLYTLCSLSLEYGRMDVYLGDFLARDLDSGRLNESQALSMIESLWNLIQARGEVFNHRVVLGGLGRPNPTNADRFALLALEGQRHLACNLPQVSLRWAKGMNPALWQKSLEMLAGGSTYPILYNDDVNVPAVAKAFAVSLEEAEQYVPFGCGEYILDHRSLGTPNGTINLATLLNVTLFNGIDPYDGRCKGLALGNLTDFRTFADLLAAFMRQVEDQTTMLAEVQAIVYRVTGAAAAFPYLSLLYDDCLSRGLPWLGGGVRYLGGTLETYGNNTAADALYAIKELVYEKGVISATELMECLQTNFAEHKRIRQLLRNVSKFGNDDPQADEFNLRCNEAVLQIIRSQATKVGLHTYQAVLINNYMHVAFGRTTNATADGRGTGDPLSNGNQPGAGNDWNGPTALLNSMAKLDPALHAGAVHNLKFGRDILIHHVNEISALLESYFENGGTQAMLTVVDRGELEAAMLHPERYPNLLVRVGGYSERFINLPRDVQLDIIQRTLYDRG